MKYLHSRNIRWIVNDIKNYFPDSINLFNGTGEGGIDLLILYTFLDSNLSKDDIVLFREKERELTRTILPITGRVALRLTLKKKTKRCYFINNWSDELLRYHKYEVLEYREKKS